MNTIPVAVAWQRRLILKPVKVGDLNLPMSISEWQFVTEEEFEFYRHQEISERYSVEVRALFVLPETAAIITNPEKTA